MGTNFYLKTEKEEPLHIGKSSAGWCFGLHVFEEGEGPQSLNDWRDLFSAYPDNIEDEYGRQISPIEMLSQITERSWGHSWDARQKPPYGYQSWQSFYIKNSAEKGPQGLVRRQIDGRHCVGHGTGTWDLILGEFS